MASNKIALVTGTSSGIGREIANVLVSNGFEVFGSARKPTGETTFHEVLMDVTDSASVNQAVAGVLDQAGKIDLLVNNAGVGLMGALEETSIDEAQDLFNVNFFGVMRAVNAVLPTMRRQKQGRIVNVSSLMGIVPAPYLGIYAASKHALECYTETLDLEVLSLGIRAILVEPGFTKTKFEANGKFAGQAISDYSDQRRRVIDLMTGQFRKGAEAREVAQVVYRAASDPSPKLRYRMPGGATLSRLRRFAPEKLFAWGVRRQLKLDEKDSS